MQGLTFPPGWQRYDRGGLIGSTMILPEFDLELIAQPEAIDQRRSLAPRFQLFEVDQDGELAKRLIATEQFSEVLAAVEGYRAARNLMQAAE